MTEPQDFVTLVTQPMDLTIFINQRESALVTDSRAIAIAFGKPNKNVLRTIDAMLASDVPEIAEHARLNFEPCKYLAENGKQERMYRMTSDGMTELAMSFTGDLARLVRIRFIAAFHEVARRLDSAEKSISQLLHDHELKSAESAAGGRIGSKLMNKRRKEKGELKDEEDRLRDITQPPLFPPQPPTDQEGNQ